ncbi:AraC family transcriptional regulator [Nocardia sp. BMG51109]|uniref:helix-turn-helix domain-containing protein n=1 Tax=Nocardia sp. BMG51109 TaxID=1056816 RepID=UPI000463BCA0|nr:helix-turn-helix domain-containing protein [Nocardia sp. BMG51109]
MIEQPRAWRLEQNGNVAFAAVCADIACYAEDAGPSSTRHRSPAWQLVLSWAGPVVATDEQGSVTTGPGVLVPPRIFRTIQRPGGYTSLWIDPHCLDIPGPPRIHALDRDQVRRLLAGAKRDPDPDPERIRATAHRILGETPSMDPRLERALEALDEVDSIDELADLAGLSPRRLRQLSTEAIGGSLVMLRRWHRLREAGLQLPFHTAAEVATRTGFADQAHLIRTSVALCGRTPGSTPAAPPPQAGQNGGS